MVIIHSRTIYILGVVHVFLVRPNNLPANRQTIQNQRIPFFVSLFLSFFLSLISFLPPFVFLGWTRMGRKEDLGAGISTDSSVLI